MLTCLRGKCRARKVASRLCKSLLEDDWEQSNSPGATVILTLDNFGIMIIPAWIRLFDRVVVVHQNAEVWLPLLSRCRLRSCVRTRMAILAYADMTSSKPEPEEFDEYTKD